MRAYTSVALLSLLLTALIVNIPSDQVFSSLQLTVPLSTPAVLAQVPDGDRVPHRGSGRLETQEVPTTALQA